MYFLCHLTVSNGKRDVYVELVNVAVQVEQVVARLQELQSTIHGSQHTSQSRFNSPKKSAAMECRGMCFTYGSNR